MGGSCTKIVTVKTPVHSNTAFHTKLESMPPQKDVRNEDKSKFLVDRLVNDKKGIKIPSQDLNSTGDHNRQQDKQKGQDKYVLKLSNMPDGDYNQELNNAHINKQKDNNLVLEGQEVHKPQRVFGSEDDAEEKKNAADANCRSNSPTAKADSVSNDKKDSNINDEFKDLNANSTHDIDGEGEYESQNQKAEVNDGDGDKESNIKEISEDDEGKLDENKDKTCASMEKGDKINNTEGQGEPQPCEVQTLIQDSLLFFPLETDKPRPVTPHKIPERLQNRPRKPPLSYNERMLLADLNRFEQLDKRREFAVKRNRSISRNGKLPKINAPKDANAEEGSNASASNDA